MQTHLQRFTKFKVEFTLTKRAIKEAIENLFTRDLPVLKESEANDSILRFNFRNLYLKRLNQIYDLDFSDLRARAEGIAYPMTVYAKDLATPNYSFEEELTRKQGLKGFLSELNDCQRAILKELGRISPENFGMMYCIDLLWKLVIIRFELLLTDEEESRKDLQERIENKQNRKMREVERQ